MMEIAWEELERTTQRALSIRTEPIAAVPSPPKALLVWVGDRRGLIPATEVLGVGRVRAVDWMRLFVRFDGKPFRLRDAKESIRVPGRPGSYFVALRSGDAQAVDGLGGFVDYEPASLRPYAMKASSGVIRGRVRAEGVRGGEAELLSFAASTN